MICPTLTVRDSYDCHRHTLRKLWIREDQEECLPGCELLMWYLCVSLRRCVMISWLHCPVSPSAANSPNARAAAGTWDGGFGPRIIIELNSPTPSQAYLTGHVPGQLDGCVASWSTPERIKPPRTRAGKDCLRCRALLVMCEPFGPCWPMQRTCTLHRRDTHFLAAILMDDDADLCEGVISSSQEPPLWFGGFESQRG